MKKHYQLFIIMVFLLLSLACTKKVNMNNVTDQANFAGVVDRVDKESIIVRVNEAQDEFKSSDLLSVSLDMEFKEKSNDFKVGDEVSVYYDGVILESYPAQINHVYLILLVSEASD